MKTNRFFTAIAVLLLMAASITASAQKNKGGSTVYFDENKVYQLMNEGNRDEAVKYLDSVISSDPNNIQAMFVRAKILRTEGKAADALNDLNTVIKFNGNPKKTGISTSNALWWKACIYGDLGELEKSASTYRDAMAAARSEKIEPSSLREMESGYASILFALGRLDECDNIYREMTKRDETDTYAMAGLARSMIERGEYAQAAALMERAKMIREDYAGSYLYASRAYEKMGETRKAIDNFIMMAELNDDLVESEDIKTLLKEKAYSVAHIKEIKKNSNYPLLWDVVLTELYKRSGEYEKAIEIYDEIENENGGSSSITSSRAECYFEVGMFHTALAEYEKAIKETDDEDEIAAMYTYMGWTAREAGMYDEAMEYYGNYIESEPTSAYGYYQKGWCYELMGDYDNAMQYYDEGIDIDKTFAYTYLMRGELFLKQGDKTKADEDFRTILQLDTLADTGSCRMYALNFLGMEKEAQDWMEQIIANEPYDSGAWYDQSCLYCRMGRPDDAVKALAKALEMGYCSFEHIEHDDDVDPIRERDDFKKLIEKYSARLEERIASLREKMGEKKDAEEHRVSEIEFTRRHGGTFDVPCTVNGVELKMIFDTGASDVCISTTEANFMLKNKYLSSNDIKGTQYYQNANGEISEGTVILLREIRLGNAVLKNVWASVTDNQSAPLLLGESAMERFSTITIDYKNNKIVLEQ